MDRFFALGLVDGAFRLSSDDERHLFRVLRHHEGDLLEAVYDGRLYEAEVVSLSPLCVKVKREIARESELGAKLALAFSLLKGGHDELVIQKGTELGVRRFIPFVSSRTIVRLEGKEKAKRVERFRKIALASAMQSRRLIVPDVMPIAPFEDALKEGAERKLIAYEDLSIEPSTLAKEIASLRKEETLLVFVGPEGGFAPKEIALAKKEGLQAIGLGPTILRAETASIMVASAFLALWGEEKP